MACVSFRPWRLLPADPIAACALFVLGASVLATALVETGADATPIAARRVVVVGPAASAAQAVAAARETAPAPSAAPSVATEDDDAAPAVVAVAPEPVSDLAPLPEAPAGTTPAGPDDATTGDDDEVAGSDAPEVPGVKHIWVVPVPLASLEDVLEPDAPPSYVRDTLRPAALLLGGYAIGDAGPPGSAVTLLSGREPTEEQRAGCPAYDEGTCVLPASVGTLPTQLTEAGRTWRGYVEAPPPADPGASPCRPDAPPGNPFLLFHAIADTPDCGASIAALDRIAPDAEDPESAPTFSLVVRDPAADPAGTDEWLRGVLEPLVASKAYADGGAVVVTAQTGALVLSPLSAAGGELAGELGPADVLRTVEDLLALDPLGRAKKADGFLSTAFTAPSR